MIKFLWSFDIFQEPFEKFRSKGTSAMPCYGWSKSLKKSIEFLTLNYNLLYFHEMLQSTYMYSISSI